MKRTITALRLAVAACTVAGAVLATAPLATAENATKDAAMSPGYTIEARVYKDWGVAHPTKWVTSAWTYHGAAFQSMTRIRNTATLASSVGTFTWSCSVGVSTGGPEGNCTGTPNVSTYSTSQYWENGNTYEADLNGYMYPSWNTTWEQVCSIASASSSSLGIHGQSQACVG